jgi:hypothetical protein
MRYLLEEQVLDEGFYGDMLDPDADLRRHTVQAKETSHMHADLSDISLLKDQLAQEVRVARRETDARIAASEAVILAGVQKGIQELQVSSETRFGPDLTPKQRQWTRGPSASGASLVRPPPR